MAGRIPQNFIDDVLDRTDIVEVIGSRIDLKKAGRSYKARCPFHDEKTPSFNVTQDKQLYHCFGCGASGNALGFVMDFDRINFLDAVELLANKLGLEIPRESQQDDERHRQREALYALLKQCDEFFRQQLRAHPAAAQAQLYLEKRGLSAEVANSFGIGLAPPGWDNLLSRFGTNDRDRQQLDQIGMIVTNEQGRTYDRFRHRIMFPIRDLRGRTIAFGGRVLGDDKPKYINSPETPVFNKSRELYGLFEARQANNALPYLLVVEGYMDVIALAQFGITNAVAALGTAFTQLHIEKLFRYTQEIIFCFDGDEAGRKAAARARDVVVPEMQDGYSAKFLFLPQGEDPDTLVRQIGKTAFEEMATSAQTLSDYLLGSLQQGIDLSKPDGRARFSKLAAPVINRLPNGVFKQLMLKEVSGLTGLDVATLSKFVAPPPEPVADSRPASAPPQQHSATERDNPAAGYDDYSAYYDGPPDYHDEQIVEHDGDWTHSAAPRRVKHTALQKLTALLIRNPALQEQLQHLNTLAALNDPGFELLVEIAEVIQAHPECDVHYLNARWIGRYGAQSDEALGFRDLAFGDWLHPPKDVGRDDVQEFSDILHHLLDKAQRQSSGEEALAQLLAKPHLTEADKKQLGNLYLKQMDSLDSATVNAIRAKLHQKN